MKRRFRFLAGASPLFVATAFVASNAWAQSRAPQTGVDASDPPRFEARGAAEAPGAVSEVVVTGKSISAGQVSPNSTVGLLGELNVFDTPFSTQGYTDKLILDQQARSITEILDNNPAIRTEGSTFSDGESQNIRGFGVGTGYLFNGVSGLLSSRRPTVEGLARVDVFLGPNALLTNGGDFNVGGTLNLVPKRAGDTPLNRVTVSLVSDSDTEIAADFGRRFGPSGAYGARVNLIGQNGDTPIRNQDERNGAATLGLDYSAGPLTASVDVIATDYRLRGVGANFTVLPGFAVPDAPSNSSNVFDRSSQYAEQSALVLARVTYQLTSSFSLAAAYGHSRHNETYTGAIYGTIRNTAGDLTANNIFYDDRAYVDAAQVQAKLQLTTWGIHHDLTASFDYSNYDYGNQYVFGSQVSTNLYRPVPLAPAITIVHGDTSPPDNTRSERTSVALADVMTLLGGRLTLIAGGRYQAMLDESFDPDTRVDDSRYSESKVTPAVALSFKITPAWSVYGNYIQALQDGPTAPAGTINAGRIFPPTVAEQKEVGTKYDLGKAGVTLALFEITQPGSYTDPVSNVFGINGDVRNRGVELTTFGEIVRGVRLLGGVSLYEPVQQDTPGGLTDGNRPQGIPTTQLNVGAELDVPRVAGLTLTSKLIRTSKEYVDLANTQSIPDWTRIDIGARYAFEVGGHAMVGRVAVENLADAGYWQDATGGRLHPGVPRTVRASLSAEF